MKSILNIIAEAIEFYAGTEMKTVDMFKKKK